MRVESLPVMACVRNVCLLQWSYDLTSGVWSVMSSAGDFLSPDRQSTFRGFLQTLVSNSRSYYYTFGTIVWAHCSAPGRNPK